MALRWLSFLGLFIVACTATREHERPQTPSVPETTPIAEGGGGATTEQEPITPPRPPAPSQCSKDTDCKTAEYCHFQGFSTWQAGTLGTCATACAHNNDCALGQVCTAGHCYTGIACQTAKNNADCPPNEFCDPAEQSCGAKPAACASASDCQVGFVCDTDHICRDAHQPSGGCHSHDQCGEGEYCDLTRGSCETGCKDDSTCHNQCNGQPRCVCNGLHACVAESGPAPTPPSVSCSAQVQCNAGWDCAPSDPNDPMCSVGGIFGDLGLGLCAKSCHQICDLLINQVVNTCVVGSCMAPTSTILGVIGALAGASALPSTTGFCY
jgi:hypothetical protein